MSANANQWAENYSKELNRVPPAGTILRAYGDEDARLNLEFEEGKPPFVYARAYVPSIVGYELGWYLQAHDSQDSRGWKVIILPKSREDFLKRNPQTRTKMRVKALKIVKVSRSGNSMLAEIAEYADQQIEETINEPALVAASEG